VKVRTRYVIAQSPTSGTGGSAKNLVVISLDLPSSGYTENLDYEDVSPLSEIGAPKALIDFQATGKTPLLDFIETFIVRFSEKLRQEVPISNNFKAVMGGSLGGNMTFRLGRRSDVPWLPKFIVWSPASIWQSLGEGSDILKHQGPRGAWEGANAARNSPSVNDRAKFFGSWDQPIFKFIIPMAQSDTWTSDYYPCKKSAVAAARLDRHETYDARFLAWHWRLGGEQLLYSHQTKDPVTNRPRFMANQKPMLLACGKEDRVPFNDICPATESTAPFMTGTPGKALFLDKTGHSLDNERRTYFARQIVEFLGL
jgi:pimeloyl-ACP methyl ester carboxylesterase